MSPNSGLALLVTCWLLASAQAAGKFCQGIAVNPAEQHNFQAQEDDHCPTEALFERLMEEHERSFCKVRSTLLKLNADRDHTFQPESVEVRRCIGSCSEGECRSMRNATRMVQVVRKHIDGKAMCGQVEVLDHLECSC